MSNSFEWFFPKTYIRKYLKQLITQRLVIVLKFLWVLNSKFANPRILGGSLCDNWKPSFLSLVIFDWRTFSRWVAAPWWCQWAKNQALTYQNSRKRWCQVVFVNNIYIYIYIYILVYIYIYIGIYIYIYIYVYMCEEESTVWMCCIVKMNKNHNISLTNFCILLILVF